MYKKILLADDLSKRAHKALDAALNLARTHGSELIILNVHEEFLDKDEMVMLRVDVSEFQDKMQEKAIAARRRIEADLADLKGQDVSTQILLREGKPAKEIINVARELDVDLIVVASHGATIKEKLLGSTSDYVAKRARRSVMLVWTGDIGRGD
ncbi:MAG TPA: universal stress protein [bacterium]|jgi:nucleotide-binding universal stress UspA family protein